MKNQTRDMMFLSEKAKLQSKMSLTEGQQAVARAYGH